MTFTEVQRRGAAQEENYRRSVDRRFQAYTDFLSRARTFRDSIRLNSEGSGPRRSASQINEYAQLADTASAFVYLVTESPATYSACQSVMRALADVLVALHSLPADPIIAQW